MSGGAFLSPHWYRVAALRPQIKAQANIRRHRFRGQAWYVVQDPASGRFNRFTPAAYHLLGLMDGRRSMDEIWALALDQLGDEMPSQEELIGLLSQLHGADLMQCEVNPDSAELFERFAANERTRRRTTWSNPFSLRFPLWDPDSFLARTLPRVSTRVAVLAALAYLGVLGGALALGAVNLPELGGNLSDRLISAQNLVLLWLCFPLVKLLHELGHAYATKAGGGEVHEMGIMLLVFMPVPYVDATAASGFRNKWRRVLVGSAGVLVELFIASLAMYVWAAVEPGLVRSIAFNVILIAGVSALVFNGNPLLRYDAYYILSDLIEIPNLASRGNRYWQYLIERHLFGMRHVEAPELSAGERRWMFFYTPAALAYRIFVLLVIVLYIASEWFFIGVVLALWGLATMFITPLGKLARYLVSVPRIGGARRRAVLVSLGGMGLVLLLLAVVPAPLRILVEGVVWLPEEAQVRAEVDGFVRRVLAEPGQLVSTGQALVESEDPVLEAQLRTSTLRLAELGARLDAQRFADRVAANITREEIEHERAEHERLQDRASRLVARSAVAGRYEVERTDDLPGRYFRKGERFGYVIQGGVKTVRIVVSQNDVDLVRNRLERVEVRLRERLAEVYPATLVRAVPAAQDQLPSAALSSRGGGALATDPRDASGNRTLERMFQFDIELPRELPPVRFGGRAYVRLVLKPEPLAQQWYRRLRQMFLERFGV